MVMGMKHKHVHIPLKPENSLFYKLLTRGNLESIREQYAPHIPVLAEKSLRAQEALQRIHDELMCSLPKKYHIADYTSQNERQDISDILYLTGLPGPREIDGGTYYGSLEAVISGKPRVLRDFETRMVMKEDEEALYIRTREHVKDGMIGGTAVGAIPGYFLGVVTTTIPHPDYFMSGCLIVGGMACTVAGLLIGLMNPGNRNPHLVLKHEIAQRTEEMLKIMRQ